MRTAIPFALVSAKISSRLMRTLRLDDDHAVRTTHAVDRGLRTPQHLDRYDVARVEPAQRATGAPFDRHAVHHEQRLLPQVNRCRTRHPHADAAAGGARDGNARDLAGQRSEEHTSELQS